MQTLILYSFNFSSKSTGGGLVQKHFSKGDTMSAALKLVGVDGNTVVNNAPVAELYIAAPASVILQDPSTGDTTHAFKGQHAD